MFEDLRKDITVVCKWDSITPRNLTKTNKQKRKLWQVTRCKRIIVSGTPPLTYDSIQKSTY